MAASQVQEIRAEPNLTPLLDVVFQLITFFMLVINFSQDNTDQRIRLPVAGSARPPENSDPAQDRLILNIDPDGLLLWNGVKLDESGAANALRREANLVRMSARNYGRTIDEAKGLPTVIVLRADRNVAFTHLSRLMKLCQGLGFREFLFKAMTGPETAPTPAPGGIP